MFQFEVSASSILILIAGIQSLLVDYFPVIAPWFEKLAVSQKRQLTAGLGIAFAIGLYALSCQGYWLDTNLVCEPQTLIQLASDIVISVAAGVAFHSQTKPSEDTKVKLGIVIPVKSKKNK